jgi:4-hydroxy-4-methyl-2-oxoglutarate aldolase
MEVIQLLSKNIDFDRMESILYSAVIADILDEIGAKNFFINPRIRPIYECKPVMGFARTVYAVDTYEMPKEPYKMEIEAIDGIREGEVLVATIHGTQINAFFGELLATAIKARKGRGAIIDGYSRDVKKVAQLELPLYCLGTCSLDSKGRSDVISYNKPIVCGDVKVYPGDIIFADTDGIVVIPQDIAEEVLTKAEAKVMGENKVREELAAGKSLKIVFDKYKIL